MCIAICPAEPSRSPLQRNRACPPFITPNYGFNSQAARLIITLELTLLMTTKVATRISLPYEQICKKWNITRFEVFGSVLRNDFNRKRSDVDVLMTFAPGAVIGWDLFELPDELEEIFGRPVDLSTRRSIEQSPNRIRKQAILESAQTVYEKR